MECFVGGTVLMMFSGEPAKQNDIACWARG